MIVLRLRTMMLAMAALAVAGCGMFGSEDCGGVFSADDPNDFRPRFEAVDVAKLVAEAGQRPGATGLRVGVRAVRPTASDPKDVPPDPKVLPAMNQALVDALRRLGIYERVESVGTGGEQGFDLIVDPWLEIGRSHKKTGLRTQHLCSDFQLGVVLLSPAQTEIWRYSGQRYGRQMTRKVPEGAMNANEMYVDLAGMVYASLLDIGIQVASAPPMKQYAATVKAERDRLALAAANTNRNETNTNETNTNRENTNQGTTPVVASNLSPAEMAEVAKLKRIHVVAGK